MKALSQYINEIKITNSSKFEFKYHPQDTQDLRELVAERLKENIETPFLLDIDTSKIKDMSELFANFQSAYLVKDCKLNPGDIVILDLRTWDVSNVTDMSCMFYRCQYLCEVKGLEKWDLKKVDNTKGMFFGCNNLDRPDGV